MRGSTSSTLLALLLGVACAGPPARAANDSGLSVALLTPGPISGQAWKGEAYRGMLAIRDSLGVSVSHIQTRTPAALDETSRAVRDGGPLPAVFALGAETGVVRFVINPALGHRIAPQARQRVDSVWATMTAGRWQSPVSRKRSAESKP